MSNQDVGMVRLPWRCKLEWDVPRRRACNVTAQFLQPSSPPRDGSGIPALPIYYRQLSFCGLLFSITLTPVSNQVSFLPELRLRQSLGNQLLWRRRGKQACGRKTSQGGLPKGVSGFKAGGESICKDVLNKAQPSSMITFVTFADPWGVFFIPLKPMLWLKCTPAMFQYITRGDQSEIWRCMGLTYVPNGTGLRLIASHVDKYTICPTSEKSIGGGKNENCSLI